LLVPRSLGVLGKLAEVAIENNLAVLDNAYGTTGNFKIGIGLRDEGIEPGKGCLGHSNQAGKDEAGKGEDGTGERRFGFH
jgi:hypothetical protein